MLSRKLLGAAGHAARAGGGGSVPLGLTDPLLDEYGTYAAYLPKTIDITAYAGATVRPVFMHRIKTSGTAFYADIQLDNITIGENNYNFESNSTGWYTTISGSFSTYASISSWAFVATVSTAERWNRFSGATGSSSTGNLGAASGSFYLYTESSVPAALGDYFWLLGPEITLPEDPIFTFYVGKQGDAIGDFKVYLDVISA